MRENERSSTTADLERRLLDLCSIDGLAPRGIAFRRLAPSPVDVRLFFGAGTLAGARGSELVARLAAEPCVAEARQRKDDVTLRPESIVRAVFRVLERHTSDGEIDDVKHSLPKTLLELWPARRKLTRAY